MPKKPNDFKLPETPDAKQPSIKIGMSSSPKKVPLPPLARRVAKVDWTEIMKKRHASMEHIQRDPDSSFYNDKAFESPEKPIHQRFYSQMSTEEIRSELPSPEKPHHSSKVKRNRKANRSIDLTETTRSISKLAFSVSLLDRIDEEERKMMQEGNKAETLDRLRHEQQVWGEYYIELDSLCNSQERAVASKRVAHNYQRLLSRALSLHDQHFTYCTDHIEKMMATMRILKREVVLALKLKEALVVKSLDREKIRKEIEEMFDNGDDFNYENFTLSARKLLDRGESQLTYHLLEAYTELAKDRHFPNTETINVTLGPLSRWEHEMRNKFM